MLITPSWFLFHSTLSWSQDEFPGLIPLVRMYINSIDIDVDTRCTIMQYLRLISKRASGEKEKKPLCIACLYSTLPSSPDPSCCLPSLLFSLMQSSSPSPPPSHLQVS